MSQESGARSQKKRKSVVSVNAVLRLIILTSGFWILPFSMPTRAQVILYTRPGCHLCEEAKREIRAAKCGADYVLEEVNIESDPALVELYGWEIPVVLINGIKAFKYRLTADEFKRKLRRLGQK